VLLRDPLWVWHMLLAGWTWGSRSAGRSSSSATSGCRGLGELAHQGLVGFDLLRILGVVSVLTITIVTLNLVVDVLCALLDPRIRLARPLRERARRGPALQPTPSQPAQARS
jgi:hypothetical protein